MSENNPDEPEPNPDDEPEPATCWERFRAELNPFQDWFLKTHPENDRPVDISLSFAPEGLKPLFFKLMCTAFVVGTAIYTLVKYDGVKGWWVVFMDNWVQIIGSMYMLLSLFNTLFGASQPYKRVSSPIVKLTWLTYSFSAHFSWLTSMFWWLFVFERGVTLIDWYHTVPHSMVPLTITFDGLNVNRIPLRWQHYFGFVIPMEVGYVVWTFIQNDWVEINNPEASEDVDDDAIYPEYNWKENSKQALFISAIGIFAIGPVIWLCMWLFAQYWVFFMCLGDRRIYYLDPRKRRGRKVAHVVGAGWYEDDGNFEDPEVSAELGPGEEVNDEEEKQEEAEGPKKYRSKLEELAYRKSTVRRSGVARQSMRQSTVRQSQSSVRASQNSLRESAILSDDGSMDE